MSVLGSSRRKYLSVLCLPVNLSHGSVPLVLVVGNPMQDLQVGPKVGGPL